MDEDNIETTEVDLQANEDFLSAVIAGTEEDVPEEKPEEIPEEAASEEKPEVAESPKPELESEEVASPTEEPQEETQLKPGSVEAILQELDLTPPRGLEETAPTESSAAQELLRQKDEIIAQQQALLAAQRGTPESATPEQAPFDQQLQQLKEHYALAPEIKDSLEAAGLGDLAEAIPSMLAQSFIDSVQSVTSLQPQLMQQQAQQQRSSERYEQAFYKYWDGQGWDLREHEQDLIQVGQAYRQINPNADIATMIKKVGSTVILEKQLGRKGQKPVEEKKPQKGFQSASNSPGAVSKSSNPQQGEPGFWESFSEEMANVEW